MSARASTDHPFGMGGCIDGGADGHVWEPVSFRFETQLLDDQGRVQIRQPAIDDAHVYFICRRCRAYTYEVYEWVGFYLGDPADLLPEEPPHADPAGEGTA